MRTMVLIMGFGGIVFYITLMAITLAVVGNHATDLLYALLGGALVSTIMSATAIANKQSGEWIVSNLFLSLAASAFCWLLAMVGLKITTVWISGTAALVFDVTIGIIGALVLYASRAHSIEFNSSS